LRAAAAAWNRRARATTNGLELTGLIENAGNENAGHEIAGQKRYFDKNKLHYNAVRNFFSQNE